jgi:hypothetical protein
MLLCGSTAWKDRKPRLALNATVEIRTGMAGISDGFDNPAFPERGLVER